MGNKDVQGPRLFADVQTDLFEKSYEEQLSEKACQLVTCLGITFDNDEKRRKHFTEKLLEKLQDPEFRKIEGFPIGSDEDILNLSDPPYYTACPNPWIADFIAEWEAQKLALPEDFHYHREPFATDVSEGKNDPIYNAHSYHTKVPHKAIMRYILHYTEPGDIVFDGFCGTGMTGVAAQMCGNRNVVMEMGYQVKPDGTILREDTDQDGKTVWVPFSKLGVRRAVLNDLSPAATFIAYNYNTPVDVIAFKREATRILQEVEQECGWMYETLHTDGRTKGKINYTVWSDVFICSDCTGEVVFWDEAIDEKEGKAKDEFNCPHCNSLLTKRTSSLAATVKYDPLIKKTVTLTKQVPVLIAYSVNGSRHKKTPDEADIRLIKQIEEKDNPYWAPSYRMMHAPEDQEKWGDRWRAGTASFTHIHHLYTKRNLWVLSAFAERAGNSKARFLLTAIANRSTRMNRIHLKNYFFGGGGWNAGYLKGAIYTPSLPIETSIFEQWEDRLASTLRALEEVRDFRPQLVSTESSTKTNLAENVFDYIFIDPPFGSNLNYSELSFLWESWLKVWTNVDQEIIESPFQNKSLSDYRKLMGAFFSKAHQALKPGRWITVEFSNTNAAVWNSIQTALTDAGFIVANVSALDKKQGSFNAVTNTTSVKQDLIISAYKPNGGFEERFLKEAETEEGVWDFVRTHLKYLPVTKRLGTVMQTITERDPRILFDQMVAFYVRKGYPVPISSQEFQLGLAQRFMERDGMFFLPEQSAEYDRQKMASTTPVQGTFTGFVDDEASAIDWLRFLLKEKPQTFQDIHPQFIKAIGGWKKTEKSLELKELLEDNFYCFEGKGEVPSQIHSYLSTNWQEFRNLPKDNPGLMAKAKDRWCVPDPKDAAQIDQMREKRLLKEFELYRAEKKKLKVFRLEAVRAGFKYLWQMRTPDAYKIIIEVAEKIPNNVLEEDPKLLMWYDQAVTRIGDGNEVSRT